MFAHGATYSGHSTCCAAALANIALLEQDDLIHRAQRLESGFYERLRTLEGSSLVQEVRGGIGLMAAVILEPELVTTDPSAGARLLQGARAEGLLTRGLADGVAVAPPLIVEDEHVDAMVAALGAALGRL